MTSLRQPLQLRSESGLPSGGPSNRGLPLDDSLPGHKTFAKPEDDTSTGDKRDQDEPIHRVDGPRDLPKDRDRVDVNDLGGTKPSYYGLGEPHNSPKTKYPYRDDKPNTHNAAVAYVAGLWSLQTAPERLLQAGLGVRLAADIETLQGILNPKIRQRARQCSASLRRADLKNMRWIFAVDCGNGPRMVRFKARRLGNVKQFHKLDFHVACSCPAWRWQGPEYHATTNNYQDPRTPLQGTASVPVIRDPQRHNTICKHVAAVLSFTSQWAIPGNKK